MAAIRSWGKMNPGSPHTVLDDERMGAYMKANFDNLTLWAYNQLPLGVMRADMWRYAVIYKEGGVYADSDASCVEPIETWWDASECRLLIAMENDIHLCQWAFAATAGHPVLASVLRGIVCKLVKDGGVDVRKHGVHFVHYYTGPGHFTEYVLRWIRPRRPKDVRLANLVGKKMTGRVCIRPTAFFGGANVRNLYASQFLPDHQSWTHLREDHL